MSLVPLRQLIHRRRFIACQINCYNAIAKAGATPYIAFKSNATGADGGLFQKRAQNRLLSACEALERYRLLTQATRVVTARADLLGAKAGEARMNKSNAAMRLLKSATG
jgi:hypothetical protein